MTDVEMDPEIVRDPQLQSIVTSLVTETALLETTITMTLEQAHLETERTVDEHHHLQLPTSTATYPDKTVGNHLYETTPSTILSQWKCKWASTTLLNGGEWRTRLRRRKNAQNMAAGDLQIESRESEKLERIARKSEHRYRLHTISTRLTFRSEWHEALFSSIKVKNGSRSDMSPKYVTLSDSV